MPFIVDKNLAIFNDDWFPFARYYRYFANVTYTSMVIIDNVSTAGMFNRKNKCIVINMSPYVLANTAINYGLHSSELIKTAACVYIDKCANSIGIENDLTKLVARLYIEDISVEDLRRLGGLATYAEDELNKG